METEKNIISSNTKLSAIAGVMFFAPFMKNIVKSDIFSDYEKSFLRGYIKIGYINLFFLVIVLLATGLNFFWANQALSRIITVGSILIYVITTLTTFACVNDISMWMDNESIRQSVQHKGQLVKSYIPIMNFVLWFRQGNYDMPYRRLKESILLRTIFIFGTLLLGNLFGIGVFVFIAIRLILLLLNFDIIPLNVKKAINSIFSCNPGETFSYLFSPIISKFRKLNYETVLQAKKQGYMQGQHFGISIILQYVLFIGILFLLYRGISFSINHVILFIAVLLRILRVGIFYIYKKSFLKIPILTEFVSLIFH